MVKEVKKDYGLAPALAALDLARSSWYYHRKNGVSYEAKFAHLRLLLEKAACEHPQYGYRRPLILLQREGCKINHIRLLRLYTEEGLTLKRTTPKRHKSTKPGNTRLQPEGANSIWSRDFVSDQLADRRRFRVLTVLDVYTRECLVSWGTSKCTRRGHCKCRLRGVWRS